MSMLIFSCFLLWPVRSLVMLGEESDASGHARKEEEKPCLDPLCNEPVLSALCLSLNLSFFPLSPSMRLLLIRCSYHSSEAFNGLVFFLLSRQIDFLKKYFSHTFCFVPDFWSNSMMFVAVTFCRHDGVVVVVFSLSFASHMRHIIK